MLKGYLAWPPEKEEINIKNLHDGLFKDPYKLIK